MKEAVVIPAEGNPYRLDIPSTGTAELAVLQKIVGGHIELVANDYFTIFCNEEGKIQNLPANWRATHLFAAEDDVLAGSVVVLGPAQNGESLGLDEEEVEQVLREATRITETDCQRWSKWHDLRMRKELATTPEEIAALAEEEEKLRDEGIAELYAQDLGSEDSWNWLSFVDPDLPDGEKFLGVAIVQGGGVMEATINARARGCNPGGEVKCYPIPDERVPPEEFRYRLLSEQELREGGLIA